jgi:hypothetical protein
LQVARVVGHLAVEHCLAGRTMQGHLKIRKEGFPAPDGERPEERPIFTHFRHERVLHPERRSQVSHERGEKAFTDFCFDPFDDREQGVFHLSATADLSGGATPTGAGSPASSSDAVRTNAISGSNSLACLFSPGHRKTYQHLCSPGS